MALIVIGGLFVYAVIGVITSVVFNLVSWKINGRPCSDDTLGIVIFIWPIALPIGFVATLSPLANKINSLIDEKHRAIRDNKPSYDMLKKKCDQLEKDLADAILVKGK